MSLYFRIFLSFLFFFSLSRSISGQIAGTPDLEFGYLGEAKIQDPTKQFEEKGMILLPDGKIILIGYKYNIDWGMPKLIFAKFLENGAIDVSYGDNGVVYPDLKIKTGNYGGGVTKIAATQDGKLILAGCIWTDSLKAAFAARMDIDGNLDISFGQAGMTILDIGSSVDKFWTLLIKPDGKILLGGTTSQIINYSASLLLAQLLPDGLIDPEFGLDGIVVYDFDPGNESIYGLELQADGKIITNGVAEEQVEIARFYPNGKVDSAFASNGVLIFGKPERREAAFAGALQPDQKLLFCGTSLLENSIIGEGMLCRLNPNGSLDETFGTNGVVLNDFGLFERLQTLTLQPDGKILVGATGRTSPTNLEYSFWILRYNMDGALDNTFGDGGITQSPNYEGFTESVGLILDSEGKILHGATVPGKLSVWRYFNDVPVGIKENPNIDFQMSCEPNPFSDFTLFEWNQPESKEVRCDLYNVQGQVLQTLISPSFFLAGQHQQTFHFGNEIPVGNCFLVLEVGNERQILRLLKI